MKKQVIAKLVDSIKAGKLIILLVVIGMVLTVSLQKQKRETPNIPPSATASLSTKEYQVLEAKYVDLVQEKSTQTALTVLEKDAVQNPAIMQSCHEFMHAIGYKTYTMTEDFTKAASYQDAVCASGYIHGVLQAYIKSAKNLQTAIHTACAAAQRDDFSTWECYHGIGHGLMYFSNHNLPLSIMQCDSLPNDFADSACANGVYMENFNADPKLHPTIYRRPNDPFYPCQTQKDGYKGDCYENAALYFLSIHNNDYALGLSWCNSAAEGYAEYCYQSIGNQATRRNMGNIPYVESVCEKGDTTQQHGCITGAVAYYIGHFGSIKKAGNICGQFSARNTSVCNQAVADVRQLYYD